MMSILGFLIAVQELTELHTRFYTLFFQQSHICQELGQFALIFVTLRSFFHFFGYFPPIFARSCVFVCEFLLLM